MSALLKEAASTVRVPCADKTPESAANRGNKRHGTFSVHMNGKRCNACGLMKPFDETVPFR